MTLTAQPSTATSAPKRRRGRTMLRRILVGLLVVLLAFGAWVGSVAGRVWWVARHDDRTRVDAIVVMGASQWDGTPTEVFAARLDHGAALWDDGVAPVVVTVGSKLKGDRFTEAGSGRSYLIDQGVAANRIVAVPQGHDTWKSLVAVHRLADRRGWDSIVLVSDPWHMFRARAMAERLGFTATTSPTRSGPSVWTRETEAKSITRETLAYVWWRLSGGMPWRGADIN